MLQNDELERFVRDYWMREAFAGEVSKADFAALREEFAGFEPRAMLEQHQGEASVWFASREGHSQAVDVSPTDAIKFFNAGMTVFLPVVRSPTIERWGNALSTRLARFQGKVGASIFLARKGWRTGCHFDHIENFTVQLRGTKIWRFEENRSVPLPTVNYGIRTERAYQEEMWLYASKDLPDKISEAAPAIELTPGKMIYLPRGYWHEIDAVTESVSLLLGFPACPWTDFLLPALKSILVRSPEWRANLLFPNGGDPGAWDQARAKVGGLLRHLESTLRELEPGDLLPPRQRLLPADAANMAFRRNPLCSVGRYPGGGGRTEVVASVHQGEFSRRREVSLPSAALAVLDTVETHPRLSLGDLEARHPDLASDLPKLLALLVELEVLLPSRHEASDADEVAKHHR
jgi:hypothetical protein